MEYDCNDLDIFSAVRYSIRGPNSLGGRSDRNISTKYRSCHPSYIGKLDLNCCSSSSPGLSGLTPDKVFSVMRNFIKKHDPYISDDICKVF